MLLGLDFDNTLISYDYLFRHVALGQGLIPEETVPAKNAVRDYLRRVGREDDWTRLQGEVYGARILEAEPFPDALATLGVLAQRHVPMCIVSHKTRTPYAGESYDLHDSARAWLTKHGFFSDVGLGWKPGQLFFELTKDAKVARIIELGCTHYIDDLPEILKMLPATVQRILFAPGGTVGLSSDWQVIASWSELPALLDLRG